MTTPEITALPEAPTPQDAPEVFNDKSFRLVAAQAQFVTEANVLAGFVADAAQAAAGADGSAAAANESALAARDVAVSAKATTLEAQAQVVAVATQFGDVAGVITAAEAARDQAGTAAAGAGDSEAAASVAKDLAQAAKAAAESARDASFVTGPKYATEALGRAAVADGVNFLVQGSGDVAAHEYRRVSAGVSTPIAAYPSASVVSAINNRTTGQESIPAINRVWGVADDSGHAALSVDSGGLVDAPLLKAGTAKTNRVEFSGAAEILEGAPNLGFAVAVADEAGNMAFGIGTDGKVYGQAQEMFGPTGWETLFIGSDDSIAHIGDSFTAAHYCLKDKAYISQLSQLSPYRHQNFGVSGDEALDMQYRIVNGSSSTGMTFEQMKARYAFITTLSNDGFFVNADLTFYAENVRRLVETVRACGTEPIITTEFPATAAVHTLLRQVADESGCAFVDCTSLDAEVGGLDLGPFHQGHPGTRTGGVFWLPMLDFIDRMPKPKRAIKVFRRRSTYAMTDIEDLLYKDRIDRARKWKEISLFHYSLNPADKFEELDQLGTFGYDIHADEYQKLATGQPVPFADYTLVEVTLPSTAVYLEAVEVTMEAGSATPAVFARDFLDVPASMPGRKQGSSPSNATYLSKWDKPRGAWRSLGGYTSPITIAQVDLKKSMQGDKLVLMIVGAFSMSSLQVRYKGREVQSDLRVAAHGEPAGPEMLAQPLAGTAGQLAAWTQINAPTTVVPLDLTNAPRKPGTNDQVDGVCVISSVKTIGQTVALPSVETGRKRRYMLTVWTRYFPKAFLDRSLYPGIDTSQVVDRIANPAGATITSDTCDLRTLKAEVWGDVAYPTQGGAEFFGFAALQWRPVDFVVEVPPYRAAPSLSFRLSCPDGEIQIAKASWKEMTS